MDAPAWVESLPGVNAGLNGLSIVLLISGYVLIRQKQVTTHKLTMLSAFAASIAFLGCYVVYHVALQHYTGEPGKRFPGTGTEKVLYLTILFSHVLLAAAVPILASMTIYRGLKAERQRNEETAREAWGRHRRIAKVTFPIWVYVSVTGVMIYVILYL